MSVKFDYIQAGRFDIIYGKSTVRVIDRVFDSVLSIEGAEQLEEFIASLRAVQADWDIYGDMNDSEYLT